MPGSLRAGGKLERGRRNDTRDSESNTETERSGRRQRESTLSIRRRDGDRDLELVAAAG